MKIRELKENEPLKVIEVTKHLTVPTSPGKENEKSKVIEDKRIKTIIITDGEIEKQTEETTQDINEFYIGKSKYQMTVDTLETKNIYFKNHSYVITYLLAKEFMVKGSVRGWFDIIKDVSIHIENKKDIKALREAKKVIKEINNLNSHTDYSSLFGMILSQPTKSERFETKEISKNIYTLKRTK